LLTGPDFSAKFSAPTEFSGGVLEKQLCTGLAQTSDPQITNPILYHCATVTLIHKLNVFNSCNAGVSSAGPPVSGVLLP
jgi:hypothetical protein